MNGLRIALALCLWTALASTPLHAADPCLTADVCLGTWDAAGKCVASEPSRDAKRPYSLGDQLVVGVKGACNDRVATLRDAKNPPSISLVLHGVEMKGLPLHASHVTADRSTLAFDLLRDSEDEPNRKAWTTLLSAKHVDGARTVDLAIAMGTDLPVSVALPGESTNGIVFEVTSDRRLGVTIVVAALVAIGLYLVFVFSPSILRDTRGGIYSLGRAQIAFWLLLVLACLISIYVITGSLEYLPPQVLILLGISSATSFAANIVGNAKTVGLHDEKQKLVAARSADAALFAAGSGQTRLDRVTQALAPKTSSARNFFVDICSDGEGVSIYRVQVVMFTITLGGVFVWTVCQVVAMPEFPTQLLTLLGLSNSTYVALKVPEKS